MTRTLATDRHTFLLKAEMTVLSFALGLLIVFSPGCSSAPGQPAAPPTADVTGFWVGTWTNSSGYSGRVTLQLQQTGSRVVGDLQMTPADPGEVGAVEGTVVANQLSVRRIGASYGADVTVNGDDMSGWSTRGSRYNLRRQK